MTQCVNYDAAFRFHQTGTRFKRGEKIYLIDRKDQLTQAKKAGIDYIPGGNSILLPLFPVWGSIITEAAVQTRHDSQKLTGPELEPFLLRRHGATWDNMPFPGFTHLTNSGYLTNAAMLLFSKDPEK